MDTTPWPAAPGEHLHDGHLLELREALLTVLGKAHDNHPDSHGRLADDFLGTLHGGLHAAGVEGHGHFTPEPPKKKAPLRHNVLKTLTREERANYDMLVEQGYPRDVALRRAKKS